mgnify:CR=1 FL=1
MTITAKNNANRVLVIQHITDNPNVRVKAIAQALDMPRRKIASVIHNLVAKGVIKSSTTVSPYRYSLNPFYRPGADTAHSVPVPVVKPPLPFAPKLTAERPLLTCPVQLALAHALFNKARNINSIFEV